MTLEPMHEQAVQCAALPRLYNPNPTCIKPPGTMTKIESGPKDVSTPGLDSTAQRASVN